SLGHSARRTAGVKVRQALGSAVLLVPWDLRDAVEEVTDLLADELNVKELSFAEDASELVRTTLRPNFATAGPDLGSRVRELAEAIGYGSGQLDGGRSVNVDGAQVSVVVTKS